MRRTTIVVTTALLCMSSTAIAQSFEPPRPAVAGPESTPLPAGATNPSWRLKPDADDVARVYPRATLMAKIGGYVRMSCKVTAEGRLANCSIMAESPPDAAFGAAALNLVPDFEMTPTTADGKSVAGATVVIPIRFQPPS